MVGVKEQIKPNWVYFGHIQNQNQNQNQNGIYCQVGLHLLGIFSGVKVHTVNIKT